MQQPLKIGRPILAYLLFKRHSVLPSVGKVFHPVPPRNHARGYTGLDTTCSQGLADNWQGCSWGAFEMITLASDSRAIIDHMFRQCEPDPMSANSMCASSKTTIICLIPETLPITRYLPNKLPRSRGIQNLGYRIMAFKEDRVW